MNQIPEVHCPPDGPKISFNPVTGEMYTNCSACSRCGGCAHGSATGIDYGDRETRAWLLKCGVGIKLIEKVYLSKNGFRIVDRVLPHLNHSCPSRPTDECIKTCNRENCTFLPEDEMLNDFMVGRDF